MKNTLNKSERLCSKKDIDLLFAEGRSRTVFPLKLMYHLLPCEAPHTQAMFVVPKRRFRRAHDRNRLRRRIKEAYRTSKHELVLSSTQNQRNCHLAFLFIGAKDEPYAVIQASVNALLKILTEEINAKREAKQKN